MIERHQIQTFFDNTLIWAGMICWAMGQAVPVEFCWNSTVHICERMMA